MSSEFELEQSRVLAAPSGTSLGRVSTARLVAFAFPGAPISGLTIPLIAYMPNFYATEVGLSLAAVGSIFMFVRLIDVAFDPLIGGLIDTVSSRFGRFKPWLVIGMVPLLLGAISLFNPPRGAGAVYLIAALGLTYAGYSICYLSHLSWASALSTDYHGRSRVFGWWQLGMLSGQVIALATPIIVQEAGGSQAAGIGAIGWVIAGLLLVGVLVAAFTVPEPALSPSMKRPSIADYWKLMIRPNIARLLAADILFGVGNGMNAALFIFYCTFLKGITAEQITVLVFLNLLGSLCGTPLWTWLTHRIGKHRASSRGFFFYALSLIAIDLMPHNFAVACLVLFAAGLTLSAGPLLLRSMMADAGDEEQLRTGQDCTGLLSALFAGTNKLGLAVSPGITFLALGLVDFNPAGGNAPQALATLDLFYVWIPAGLGILAAWVVRRHPLTAERHAEIRVLLERAAISEAG